jgi:glycosyltransferase involved in cell wall biosynthesis
MHSSNKILMAIGSSVNGGAQNVFHIVLKKLIDENQDVIVILPDGPFVDVLALLKIKLYIINFNSIRDIFRIYKIIKNEQCDIINTHLTKCNIMVSIVNLLFRKPTCSTLHNDIIHAGLNSAQRFIYPYFYKILATLNDGFIVVSEYSKQDLINVAGVNDSKIQVIHNGIDLHSFTNIDHVPKQVNKYIFACVGHLTIEKGHVYLINAIASLKDHEFECWIIGDGGLRGVLEQQVIDNSDEKKIIFLGHRHDVNVLLQQVDSVILPSINENLPISILEALALKKSVIASDIGGIAELIVHKKSGILVPPKDSEKLAKAMLQFYNDREYGVSLGEEGYIHVLNNFSSEMMFQKTWSYYNNLIKGK